VALLPPAPVQVSMNVVVEVIGDEACVPEVASAALQPPVALQPVAF
jgi:hypothetical protein